MTKASDSPSKMTAKEYAALHMRVPQSGTAWLDSMIQAARELDSDQFQAKLRETQSHPVLGPSPYDGPSQPPSKSAKSKPQGPKNPPAGGTGTKVG